jgi:hypothetical protein
MMRSRYWAWGNHDLDRLRRGAQFVIGASEFLVLGRRPAYPPQPRLANPATPSALALSQYR